MNARKSVIPNEIVIYAFARTQQWLTESKTVPNWDRWR
jgi:hypothetical protein